MPRLEELKASSKGDAVLAAAVGRHLSYLYAMVGRFDESRSLEHEAAPVLDEAQVESLSWGSLGASSRAKLLMGDVDGAANDLRTKWHVYPVEAGKMQKLAIAAAKQLAWVYCQAERWDEAEACIASLRRQGDESVNQSAAALLATHYGNHEEAVILSRRVIEGRAGSDVLVANGEAWIGLSKALRGAGMNDEADDAMAQGLDFFEQKGNVVGAEQARRAEAGPTRPAASAQTISTAAIRTTAL
jgi:hypothetical protein